MPNPSINTSTISMPPRNTFEQYVEKALKYNFRCVFANLQEYETGRAMLEGSDIILAGAIDFPRAL